MTSGLISTHKSVYFIFGALETAKLIATLRSCCLLGCGIFFCDCRVGRLRLQWEPLCGTSNYFFYEQWLFLPPLGPLHIHIDF